VRNRTPTGLEQAPHPGQHASLSDAEVSPHSGETHQIEAGPAPGAARPGSPRVPSRTRRGVAEALGRGNRGWASATFQAAGGSCRSPPPTGRPPTGRAGRTSPGRLPQPTVEHAGTLQRSGHQAPAVVSAREAPRDWMAGKPGSAQSGGQPPRHHKQASVAGRRCSPGCLPSTP